MDMSACGGLDARSRTDEYGVNDNPFRFSPGQLNKLFNPKSLAAFWAIGGLAGLENGLRTNRGTGLNASEAADAHAVRKSVFAENVLPGKKSKNLPELLWIELSHPVLILLTTAAIISLAIGFHKSSFGEPGDWLEGLALISSIIIVVLIGAVPEWQKERQFAKLNAKKEARVVRVVRSGKMTEISVFDILVGDILALEPGDLIPADGVLVSGHRVICDESSMTGESALIKKTPGNDAIIAIANGGDSSRVDPFIISGTRVIGGIGTFMVTSVGVNSTYGKTLMSLSEDALESSDSERSGLLNNFAMLSYSLDFVVVVLLVAIVAVDRITSPATTALEFPYARWFVHSWDWAVVGLKDLDSPLGVVGLIALFTILAALPATRHAKGPTDVNYMLHQLTYVTSLGLLLSLLPPQNSVSQVADPNTRPVWVNFIMDTFAVSALATIATHVIWGLPSGLRMSVSAIVGEGGLVHQASHNRLTALRRILWSRTALYPATNKYNSNSLQHGVSMMSWIVSGLFLLMALVSAVFTEPPGCGTEGALNVPYKVHWQEPVLILTSLMLYGSLGGVWRVLDDLVLLSLLDGSMGLRISPYIPMMLLVLGRVLTRAVDGLPPTRALLLPAELGADVPKICDRVGVTCFHARASRVLFYRGHRVRSSSCWIGGNLGALGSKCG